MANPTQLPTTTRGLHDTLRGGLDWIDVLLFVGTVALLFAALPNVMPRIAHVRAVGLVVFAPVVARRMLFGAPDRGVMRSGALWSAVGMVGLLALLFGAGATCMGGWVLSDVAARTEPDWAAVIRAEREQGPTISVERVIPGESAEVRAAREKAKVEAEISAEIPNRHADWLQDKARSSSKAWMLTGFGLALVAVGALVDRMRFYRPAGEKT